MKLLRCAWPALLLIANGHLRRDASGILKNASSPEVWNKSAPNDFDLRANELAQSSNSTYDTSVKNAVRGANGADCGRGGLGPNCEVDTLPPPGVVPM